MAGVKQPLQDLLARLATMDVTNRDGYQVKLYARVWNNQVLFEAEGDNYAFPKPAAFVEVINNATYEEIGGGYASCDIVFRIHLVHEYYNQDGTFEQDLEIFDLRDQLIGLLNHYKPTGCGLLVRMAEAQQYDHANVYEYLIDFGCNFTDSTGSDDDRGLFITKEPPTGLDLTVNIDDEPMSSNQISQPYRIPK